MTQGLVFLLDVDNTLLDADRFVADLRQHLDNELGAVRAQLYWRIFDALRADLGYVDYLGALQRLHREASVEPDQDGDTEHRLLSVAGFMLDYPFAERLYPRALDVIGHLGRFGRTVILTDGDVVLQPRKLRRSGLWDAVGGRVLICAHKERMLDRVERRHPARHYVMVDDKLRILDAMKSIWQDRLTTIFPRQGHYALDPAQLAGCQAADFTIEHIGELADTDLSALLQRPATDVAASRSVHL
ncbi:MAG: HAD family hydrolase [Burkholderiales bacterium]